MADAVDTNTVPASPATAAAEARPLRDAAALRRENPALARALGQRLLADAYAAADRQAAAAAPTPAEEAAAPIGTEVRM